MTEACSTALKVSSYQKDEKHTRAIETKIKHWRDDNPGVIFSRREREGGPIGPRHQPQQI